MTAEKNLLDAVYIKSLLISASRKQRSCGPIEIKNTHGKTTREILIHVDV